MILIMIRADIKRTHLLIGNTEYAQSGRELDDQLDGVDILLEVFNPIWWFG